MVRQTTGRRNVRKRAEFLSYDDEVLKRGEKVDIGAVGCSLFGWPLIPLGIVVILP